MYMHYFENKLFAIEGPEFYISCRMSVSSHIYICADPVIFITGAAFR